MSTVIQNIENFVAYGSGEVTAKHNLSLRELYRTLDNPGDNPLRKAQEALDAAVRAAYGMAPGDEPLEFLLKLNLELAAREAEEKPIVGPGLPPVIKHPEEFITDDCIRMPQERGRLCGSLRFSLLVLLDQVQRFSLEARNEFLSRQAAKLGLRDPPDFGVVR